MRVRVHHDREWKHGLLSFLNSGDRLRRSFSQKHFVGVFPGHERTSDFFSRDNQECPLWMEYT